MGKASDRHRSAEYNHISFSIEEGSVMYYRYPWIC